MKTLYIMDPGHGGLIGGKYVTAGKRSPHPVDGKVFYEGVNNRDNVARTISAMKLEGIECTDIVASNDDISLVTRVQRANALAKNRKSMYISFHSDAANGGDVNWIPTAKGISVYTYIGQSKSDEFAEILIKEIEKNMGHMTTIRKDTKDGDMDKEAKFQVLRETTCPSVLIEAGFHTNEEECRKMLTDEWKNALVKSIVDACKKWELLN